MAQAVTYRDGMHVRLRHPDLNGRAVNLAGTSTAHEPVISVTDGVNNDWDSINVKGTSTHSEAFGQVTLGPNNPGNLTLDNGIQMSYGNLTLGGSGKYTLNGVSYILNHSTLTLGGGGSPTKFTVNGHVSVANDSTGNFDDVALKGTGSIGVEGGSTLTVDQVAAGLYGYVGRGGNMVLENGMHFLGTIVEDNGANIDILGAGRAVQEVLHQSLSGRFTTMDLLNQHGNTVAQLKFLDDANVYAAPDGHGGMNISDMPMNHQLPITFAH